jgi:uncharacterized membrane protein
MRTMSKRVAASATVVIERPLNEVFEFFADAENDPLWRSGVKSIHRVGEPGIGAVYQQKVAGPGGRDISADVRVVEFNADQKVVFETISGPVRPSGTYRFEPVGSGTRVSFDLTVELTGIKALVLAGPVQRSMDAEVAGLSRAKTHLEQV